MTFASKVVTVEKSCQVRRVKAVQDLSLKLGHGAEDKRAGNLSPSSGKKIAYCKLIQVFTKYEAFVMNDA